MLVGQPNVSPAQALVQRLGGPVGPMGPIGAPSPISKLGVTPVAPGGSLNDYLYSQAQNVLSSEDAIQGLLHMAVARKALAASELPYQTGTPTPFSTMPYTGNNPLIHTLQAAGFKGPALQKAWAIAMRESNGNANAFNGNAATGDKSYGLFQINMLGALGPERLKQYGLKNNAQLFNPNVNAHVAYLMSKGGTDFGAWGIGPNAYKGAPVAAYARYQQLLKQFPGGMMRGANPGDPTDARAVALAREFIGTPYVYGGASPHGFDCSGLLQYVWGKEGISIPRTTYTQWKAGTAVRGPLRPGDAVFFKGSDSVGGLPGHVGMYIGNGKFIESPHTGAVVRISTLQGYPGYMGARRFG